MRAVLVAYCVLILPVMCIADDAKPITTDAAATKVGEKVTVEMQVQSTGGSKQGLVFLNSLVNFRDGKNFTIVIKKEALEGLRKAKVDDPKAFYKSKTIIVSGTVTLHQNHPQIEVSDAEQIKVK